MPSETTSCLYCQTKMALTEEKCTNCGMPLAKEHPEGATSRQRFFRKAFWGIVIFCLVMVYYLPR